MDGRLVKFMVLMGWLGLAGLLTMIIMSMTGCGRDNDQFQFAGPTCTSKVVSGGHVLSCSGSPDVFIADGQAGANGLNGTDGKDGANGTNGTNGVDGKDGKDGANGTNGVDGKDGKDANPVTTVQFCPGYGPTVYPSSFPEFGLVIGGQIYSVYWDKGNLNAWLALNPPGLYQSTATGLGCTFVINADGTVTQQ